MNPWIVFVVLRHIFATGFGETCGTGYAFDMFPDCGTTYQNLSTFPPTLTKKTHKIEGAWEDSDSEFDVICKGFVSQQHTPPNVFRILSAQNTFVACLIVIQRLWPDM
jgi:hypothetical protein